MNIMILIIRKFIEKYLIELISLVLFASLVYLYSFINFYQNDDWNRNTTILRFLAGDFTLLQVTATTFYSQGVLGFLWASLLGPTKIPYLTLLISVLNFYLFWKILQIIGFSNQVNRFFLSLLFFTNPFHIYSSIGFMTENYVIFYLLLALFFYLKYEKELKINFLIFSAIFGFLAFYAKQSALVFLFGGLVFFLLNKKWLESKIFGSSTALSLISYYFIFPRTSEMRDKDFSFLNLNFDYIFSLTYGSLIYLSFFTLPLIFYILWNFINERKYLKIFLVLLFTTCTYFVSNYFFKPGLISWEEFPYFENTFERTGFLPRTIDGTKYQFKFNYDLYYYLDIFSKIALSFLVTIFLFKFIEKFKNRNIIFQPNNINLYIILINFGLMCFVSIFFDRYLLIFLPFFILFFINSNLLSNTKFLSIFLIPFVIFQSYFSFLLASDFIYSHNYIWSKSAELVQFEDINPRNIDATGAWNRTHKLQNPIYIFSYDSPKINENYRKNFILVETKEINFKGNLFINPKIYLYKSK